MKFLSVKIDQELYDEFKLMVQETGLKMPTAVSKALNIWIKHRKNKNGTMLKNEE